jgi:uncharacterized protein YegL
VTESDNGISALLALDTSGSMVGAPIAAARDAASNFVGTLGPVDEVAVVSFADRVVVASPYTQDFRVAQTSVSTLGAVGNTALYQAVSDTSSWASQRGSERRVIILLSDGADFGGVSSATRQQSIDAASQARVPFYVIGLGSQIDRQYLQDLTTATRGRLFVAPSSTQLRQIFSEIGRQVRTQYAVTLDLSSTPIEGDVLAKLTVRMGSKSGAADLQLNVPLVLPRELPATPVEEEGMKVPTWLIFTGLGALTGYVLLRVVVRLSKSRAIHREAAYAPASLFHQTQPAASADSAPDVLGRLVGQDGETFALTRSLVSLGTDADSTYRLPINGATPGSVRIWLGNEHFIVHDTSPRTRMKLNGNPTRWGVLRDGDNVEIGGLKLRFESAQ